VELTRRLVAVQWRSAFNAGHLHTVQSWLDALPGDVVAADRQLTAARVWLSLDAGRLDEANTALDAAERAQPGDVHVQVLRALHTYKLGDVGTAARLVQDLTTPVADRFLMTVCHLLAGVCALWLGDLPRADDALREAADIARRNDNRLAGVYALGCSALLAVERGDPGAAAALLAEADAEVVQAIGDAHFVAMFPALARARLAAALGNRDEAAAAARTAVDLARRGAGRVELAAALVTAAHTAGPEQDGTSERLLDEAGAAVRACPDPGPVVGRWLGEGHRSERTAGAVDRLTEREAAILALLPGPLTQRELAAALFVTPNTLKTHLRAIYRKLGADSRSDAVARARSSGLV
jgi:LuxR family maltose regulon positive regulatory protein